TPKIDDVGPRLSGYGKQVALRDSLRLGKMRTMDHHAAVTMLRDPSPALSLTPFLPSALAYPPPNLSGTGFPCPSAGSEHMAANRGCVR
ncbi:hypothetical protein KUCAC02_014934, partial [Chaenocephalus aceratus]